MATKTSLKRCVQAASNFTTLLPSHSFRQNVGEFLGLKDYIKVQEKKRRVVVFCSRLPQNVKLGSFKSYLCNNGKEMYEKA